MDSLYYIGISQSIFAILLLRKKKSKSLADKLLMLFISVIGVEMTYSLINGEFVTSLPDLIVLPFCYGPFLYYYAKLQVESHSTTPKSIHKHLIPTYIFAFISLVWPGELEVNTINYFHKGAISVLSMINFCGFILSMSYYTIKVWSLLTNYNKHYDDQFSHESVQLRLNWVKVVGFWILGSFLLSFLVYIVFVYLNIFPVNPIVFYHVGIVVFLFSISYFGLNQPPVKLKDMPTSKSVSPVKGEDTVRFLNDYMMKEKPFLNGELTLHELSDKTGLPQTDISNVLNHYLNKNFFTYINEYRIGEAKERLLDTKYDAITILAIGYDSGFNSKSTFNSLFKKHTGLTPSAFRKEKNK